MTVDASKTRTTRSAASTFCHRKRDRDDCDSPVECSAPDRKRQNKSRDKNSTATPSASTTEDINDIKTYLNKNIQITADNIDLSIGKDFPSNNDELNPLLKNVSRNRDGNQDSLRMVTDKPQGKPTNHSMDATNEKKWPPFFSTTEMKIANGDSSTNKNGSNKCENKNDSSETRDSINANCISLDHRPQTKENCGSGNGGCLIWFVLFWFINFTVLFEMIWSGLLLNERALYQLESFECRERLQQLHQEIGLPAKDFDFNNNIYEDTLDEQRYHWQELESQVRYWKKEAKKFQRYSDGFKDQCNDDLQKLLQQVVPQQL